MSVCRVENGLNCVQVSILLYFILSAKSFNTKLVSCFSFYLKMVLFSFLYMKFWYLLSSVRLCVLLRPCVPRGVTRTELNCQTLIFVHYCQYLLITFRLIVVQSHFNIYLLSRWYLIPTVRRNYYRLSDILISCCQTYLLHAVRQWYLLSTVCRDAKYWRFFKCFLTQKSV